MENTTDTQNKKILAYLQKGKSITPMDALKLCGCFRLSARIFDLREKGYVINTDLVFIRGKRVAKYTLVDID